MGTNYYQCSLLGVEGAHIGKRSAAGMYCWDCGRTLCKAGPEGVHFDVSTWAEACPECGQVPQAEALDASAVGVELGFAKPRSVRPTGVRSCSSFTWAMTRTELVFAATRNPRVRCVMDEYGRRTTAGAFLRMVEANCPIQREALGEVFS